jgi:hypothetical protein
MRTNYQNQYNNLQFFLPIVKKELYTTKECFTLRAWKRRKRTAAPARAPNMQKICIFLAVHRQILNRGKRR